jgi:hypothetical protein
MYYIHQQFFLDHFDKKINVALKFWKQFCIRKLKTCVDNLFLGDQRTIFVAQHFDLLNHTILAHVSYTKLHLKILHLLLELFHKIFTLGQTFGELKGNTKQPYCIWVLYSSFQVLFFTRVQSKWTSPWVLQYHSFNNQQFKKIKRCPQKCSFDAHATLNNQNGVSMSNNCM